MTLGLAWICIGRNRRKMSAQMTDPATQWMEDSGNFQTGKMSSQIADRLSPEERKPARRVDRKTSFASRLCRHFLLLLRVAAHGVVHGPVEELLQRQQESEFVDQFQRSFASFTLHERPQMFFAQNQRPHELPDRDPLLGPPHAYARVVLLYVQLGPAHQPFAQIAVEDLHLVQAARAPGSDGRRQFGFNSEASGPVPCRATLELFSIRRANLIPSI